MFYMYLVVFTFTEDKTLSIPDSFSPNSTKLDCHLVLLLSRIFAVCISGNVDCAKVYDSNSENQFYN